MAASSILIGIEILPQWPQHDCSGRAPVPYVTTSWAGFPLVLECIKGAEFSLSIAKLGIREHVGHRYGWAFDAS